VLCFSRSEKVRQKFEQMSEGEQLDFFERQNEKSQTDENYRDAVISGKGVTIAEYLCGQTDSSAGELKKLEDLANTGDKMAMYNIAAVYYECSEYYDSVDNSRKAFRALVMANLWVEEAQMASQEYTGKQKEAEENRVQELKRIRERIAKYRSCIAAISRHTVGLKTDGTVVAVGSDTNDLDKKVNRNTDNWRGIIAVATGNYHTVRQLVKIILTQPRRDSLLAILKLNWFLCI